MGWFVMIALGAASWLALWRFGKLERQALELAGAALLIAGAGYAWQGRPDYAGISVSAEDKSADVESSASVATFKDASDAIQQGDALMQAGKMRAAVALLGDAVKRFPKDADLRVMQGNALMVAGGGQANPASQFAFEAAAGIAPDHPGPPFFLGYGLVRAGKLEEAGQVWRGLLERIPPDSPLREELNSRLGEINQLPVDAKPTARQKAK
jgi:cytochrome c-type biogenesis protein CcmH